MLDVISFKRRDRTLLGLSPVLRSLDPSPLRSGKDGKNQRRTSLVLRLEAATGREGQGRLKATPIPFGIAPNKIRVNTCN